MTDDLSTYDFVTRRYRKHYMIRHSDELYARKDGRIL